MSRLCAALVLAVQTMALTSAGHGQDRPAESIPRDLARHVDAGRKRITRYFGKPFRKLFKVVVLDSRAAMDRYFEERWGMEKTERWMVAAGVADTLVILSPRVWSTEAVDHDGTDARHVAEVVAHEMVHVYHGQNNPSHEFDGMDDLGWFVEGLATLVSGQLANSHANAAREAITTGRDPRSLAAAWSGKYRYGVCGSLVGYVESRWGRKKVASLLSVTRPEEALRILGTSEQDLLAGWKRWVVARSEAVAPQPVARWDEVLK
jgi:hypothetical protein